MCIKELPRSRNLELGLSGYYCLEKQKTFETLMLYLFCNPTYLMFFSDMMNDIFSSPRLEVCRAELTKEGRINQFDERHEHGTCGWKLVDIINRCHQGAKGLFWNCWDDQRGTNTMISTCYHCGTTLKCVIKKWWTTDLPSWVWYQDLDASKDIPKQKCWEATSNKVSNLPSKSGNF